MTTHWACLHCPATGAYEHTAKSGDSGPAWQHTKVTTHTTSTTTTAEHAARWHARVTGQAAVT